MLQSYLRECMALLSANNILNITVTTVNNLNVFTRIKELSYTMCGLIVSSLCSEALIRLSPRQSLIQSFLNLLRGSITQRTLH